MRGLLLLVRTSCLLLQIETRLRQALIEDRKNMDVPLFTMDANGYIYIREVRIGYFRGGKEFWKKALSDPVRPYAP